MWLGRGSTQAPSRSVGARPPGARAASRHVHPPKAERRLSSPCDSRSPFSVFSLSSAQAVCDAFLLGYLPERTEHYDGQEHTGDHSGRHSRPHPG